MAIVIFGNPVDGLTLYGPFKDCEEAARWAENNCPEDWWVTSLTDPSEARRTED